MIIVICKSEIVRDGYRATPERKYNESNVGMYFDTEEEWRELCRYLK